jgi:hypothetical protein
MLYEAFVLYFMDPVQIIANIDINNIVFIGEGDALDITLFPLSGQAG